MASYLSWAAPRAGHSEGLIGPAGELVVHEALRYAAGHGLTLVQPIVGKVRSIFGADVPGGTLDNAAWLLQLDSTGRPRQPVLAPIEVKNIRHWLYPSSDEVFQLLHKAAALQTENPDVLIYPVLVCRERSYTLSRMAHDLGFRVVNTHSQFLLGNASVRPAILAGVQSVLGFSDLHLIDDSDPSTLQEVMQLLPSEAPANALTWKRIGSQFVDYYRVLRDELAMADRSSLLDRLRADVRRALAVERLHW